MQSNKTSKKTRKIADENVASPESVINGETAATPRTARSSKPKSETGESASMKLHRKATSIPTQETAPANETHSTSEVNAPAAEAAAASVASNSIQEQPRVTHEEIARLAHAYSVERGNGHGSPVDDWIRAERELLSRR
jgi:hypothetical protein